MQLLLSTRVQSLDVRGRHEHRMHVRRQPASGSLRAHTAEQPARRHRRTSSARHVGVGPDSRTRCAAPPRRPHPDRRASSLTARRRVRSPGTSLLPALRFHVKHTAPLSASGAGPESPSAAPAGWCSVLPVRPRAPGQVRRDARGVHRRRLTASTRVIPAGALPYPRLAARPPGFGVIPKSDLHASEFHVKQREA